MVAARCPPQPATTKISKYVQVFEEAHSILQGEGYRDMLPHVTIVRIPPCDQVGLDGDGLGYAFTTGRGC